MAERDGVRLFIGVPLSIECTESVARTAHAMKTAAETAGLRGRWVPPVNYHVTLKFLGWCRPEVVAAVRDVVGRVVSGGAFGLTPRGAGAFPRDEKGRVLWVGADDEAGKRLAGLADAVDRAVEGLGFERESRPFHAHITVGRLRELADVRPVVLAGAEQKHSPSAVNAVVLYESQMSSAGSEYRAAARWPL